MVVLYIFAGRFNQLRAYGQDMCCREHNVVNRATANNQVRYKIRGAGCMIWNEGSMSIRRILEIANYIHHDLAKKDDVAKPFAVSRS